MAAVIKSASANTRKARSAGFTLIEFGIVIMISGFVMASALSLYSTHLKRQKIATTYERLFDGNTLMTELWNIRGSYPCPADPNLEPTDPNYGRSQCPASSVNPGTCTRAGGDGICVSNGISSELKNRHVLTGMLPFKSIMEAYEQQRAELERAYNAETDPTTKDTLRRTLMAAKAVKFTEAYSLSLDGWGNQYTYAVSRVLAADDSITAGSDTVSGATALTKKTAGSVEIINSTAGTSDVRRGVHFAIISHGENGLGSRTRFGVRKNACTAGAGMSQAEIENCDYDTDGTFLRPAISNLRTTDTVNYTDDIVVYNVYVAEDVWEKVACSGSTCLRNRNPGNVGINIDTTSGGVIDQRLTVGGRLQADTMSSKQLCDAAGGNCFSPSLIGGTDMNRCSQSGLPANQRRVAQRIANNQITCVVVTLPIYNTTCPLTPGGGRQLVRGYGPTGVVCADPCTPDYQQRVVPCSGSDTSGTVTLESTYSCTTRTWSSWGEIAGGNQCAVACINRTETRTIACPVETYTGIITEQRTRTCPGTFGPWTVVSNTCTPPPPKCRRFNLSLTSNCNPAAPVSNTIVSCDADKYASNTSMSSTYDTCAPTTTPGPDLTTAQGNAKAANCVPLLAGQTHTTSGCP